MGYQLTEGRPILDILAQEISRADGLQLREPIQQPLGLRALPDARRANKDNSRRPPKPHARPPLAARGRQRR